MTSLKDLALKQITDYIGSWLHFRPFSSLDTIRKDLRLTEPEARMLVTVACQLGLGRRRCCKPGIKGGVVWNEREARKFMGVRRNAA